jgi:xanthine/CO dehydrogenase XdhC/CoxF family maturation factor
MNDQRELIRTLAQLDVPVVLATILHTEGPAMRLPGTRALLGPTAFIGMLSCDAMEQTLIEQSKLLLLGGNELFCYDDSDSGNILFDVRKGIGGKTHVLLEHVKPQQFQPLFKTLHRLLQERDFAELYTIAWSEGDVISRVDRLLFSDGFLVESVNADTISLEAVQACRKAAQQAPRQRVFKMSNGWILREIPEPAPRLVICGYSAVASAIRLLAKQLDWETLIRDHRNSIASKWEFVHVANSDNFLEGLELDDRTAVLAMTYQLDFDLQIFKSIADKPFFYFGLPGSRKRVEQFERMLNPFVRKFKQENIGRIFLPAGLDIHAETAEEIALSITAEIQAVMRGRSGMPLSQTNRPIHNL